MDTVSGVKLSGEIQLQNICETWVEGYQYDED
jgi:hypothetical protein